jgi:hypothetical protein
VSECCEETSADENLDVNKVKNWRWESVSADGPGFHLEKDDWSKEVQVTETLLRKSIEEDVVLQVYERMPDEPVDCASTWKTNVRSVAWMRRVPGDWRREFSDRWFSWRFHPPDRPYWGGAENESGAKWQCYKPIRGRECSG